MTVSNVSTGHQYPVCPFKESLKQEAMAHSSCAHQADQTYIRWILHAGHPRQIGPGIGAPVTHKGYNFRLFRGRHGHSLIPNFARFSKCHCEEPSGCEAEPKQTWSLSLTTEKYNGLTSQKLRFLAALGTGSAIPSLKDCFAVARNDRNRNAFQEPLRNLG